MENSAGHHPADSDESWEAAYRRTSERKRLYRELCEKTGEPPIIIDGLYITQEEEDHYTELTNKLIRLEAEALAEELGISISPEGDSALMLKHLNTLKKNKEVAMQDSINDMPEGFWKTDKALKNDGDKDRMELVPALALRYVSKAFTHGAEKYGKFNYLKGMEWSRLIGAAHRHLNATELRIDYDNGDKGSGLLHTAHAVASLMMLLEYQLREIGEDDRAGMDGFANALEKMRIE